MEWNAMAWKGIHYTIINGCWCKDLVIPFDHYNGNVFLMREFSVILERMKRIVEERF